ncbi:hypothetical protein LTR53_003101 [Teratosphaeriaceae sp. CCFEE 6253]|nr:hypothetical protein LTR53_003101 [Teratosphaeriaceae sp. CCFEE 6253]
MANLADLDVIRIVVLGGTGNQGLSVVKALSHNAHYRISVLTRDPTSAKALRLQSEHDVTLIPGTYTTLPGLHAALDDQDVAYISLDSFSLTEAEEYFWTFRAYDIAVQSGLKLFIYPGTRNRFAQHGYQEECRNSHNVVSARITEWLTAQPLQVGAQGMGWYVLTGGVYAEMLWSLLRPVRDREGAWTFANPCRQVSVIPLVPLEMYGVRVRWIMENPAASVGRFVSAAPFHASFPEIAAAFAEINGVPARFQPVETEEWMSAAAAVVDVEGTLPRGSRSDDPFAVTFRQSFSAWWMLWQDSMENEKDRVEAEEWVEAYYPQRGHSIRDWMAKSGYGPKTLAKLTKLT